MRSLQLKFFSKDNLAGLEPLEGHYRIALVRNGLSICRVVSAGELINIINSTLFDQADGNTEDAGAKAVRERFEITFEEAVRLKECYISMKIYNGHDL